MDRSVVTGGDIGESVESVYGHAVRRPNERAILSAEGEVRCGSRVNADGIGSTHDQGVSSVGRGDGLASGGLERRRKSSRTIHHACGSRQCGLGIAAGEAYGSGVTGHDLVRDVHRRYREIEGRSGGATCGRAYDQVVGHDGVLGPTAARTEEV